MEVIRDPRWIVPFQPAAVPAAFLEATRCLMLGNLRISFKLLIMIGLSILGIALMAGMGLTALWNNLML